MTREDLRIHLRKPVQIHTSGRVPLLRPPQGFRRGILLRFCHQAISQSLPIHFLKIEVTRAVQIFRKLCAAGLKLWNRGEASRSRSFCTIRQNFPKRFRAARADHHVRRYSHIEKIPLRDARASLFPSEGYFEESYVALVAFRSQLIAEERPHQLERFRLLANPKKVDLFRRVQRRTRLHRCEFSRWQAECIRQRHTEPCGRERVEHVRVTLLSLRKCGLCYPFYDAVNPHEIDLSRAVGNRIRGRKREGGGRARACRPNVEGRSGSGIAENRGLHVCFRTFLCEMAADGMDRFKPRRFKQWTRFEAARVRIRSELLQIGYAGKKFKHAAAKNGLRLSISRRLRQRR